MCVCVTLYFYVMQILIDLRQMIIKVSKLFHRIEYFNYELDVFKSCRSLYIISSYFKRMDFVLLKVYFPYFSKEKKKSVYPFIKSVNIWKIAIY